MSDDRIYHIASVAGVMPRNEDGTFSYRVKAFCGRTLRSLRDTWVPPGSRSDYLDLAMCEDCYSSPDYAMWLLSELDHE